MGLCIKEKAISLKHTFFVYDESGKQLYYVKGKALSLGDHLKIYTMQDEVTAEIDQELLHIGGHYKIRIGEEEVLLKEKMSLLHSHFVMEEKGWDIRGKFTAHEYTITKQDETIAQVQRKWFSIGDTYYLECMNPADELLCLAVMICVDCAEQNNRAAASATA